MSTMFFVALLFISATMKGDAANVDFYHLCGGIMLAQPYGQYSTLDDALVACNGTTACAGVMESSETEFRTLFMFTNIKQVSGSFDYYLADRSNGLSLPNAPSATDIKVMFAIYPRGSCPSTMTQTGTTCTGRPEVTREMCAEYPAYMNAKFYNGKCVAVTKEAIIKTWS